MLPMAGYFGRAHSAATLEKAGIVCLERLGVSHFGNLSSSVKRRMDAPLSVEGECTQRVYVIDSF